MRFSKDHTFEFLTMVALCQHTLFDYFRVFMSKLPVVGIFSSAFFPIVYFLLIFMAYRKERVKWIRAYDIIIILFFFTSTCLSVIIYPVNAQYIMDRLTISIIPCLPFFLLALCLVMDRDILLRLSNCCCIAIAVTWIYIFFYMATGRELDGDEMGRSYALLPNVLIVMSTLHFSGKKRYWIFSGLGFLYILAMGTRGPIVILGAYILTIIWKKAKIKNSAKVIVTAVIVGLVVLFVQTNIYISLMTSIRTFLRQNGLSTRIIDYLMKGNMISDSSGRNEIYDLLLELLRDRPFIGYGVYGEWQFINYSAHNVYLETVFQYGWPIGVLLILLYGFTVWKSYRMSKNPVAKEWILAWSCFVFVRGFFGGELLNWNVFFLLGFCLKEIRVARSMSLGVRVDV